MPAGSTVRTFFGSVPDFRVQSESHSRSQFPNSVPVADIALNHASRRQQSACPSVCWCGIRFGISCIKHRNPTKPDQNPHLRRVVCQAMQREKTIFYQGWLLNSNEDSYL